MPLRCDEYWHQKKSVELHSFSGSFYTENLDCCSRLACLANFDVAFVLRAPASLFAPNVNVMR